MAEQPELEFLLAWDEPDVMEDFLKHVANGGLAQYKRITQWGEKVGEPLYTHAINGVFTAHQLHAVLSLTDDEARVLYSAFAIHDLNKALDSEGKSFNKLASLDAVQAELENIGVPDFFPAYHDYLEDITLLIRSHSGHYHTDGEWLIRKHNPYRLPRERLEVLRALIKALDDLDMSDTLTERDHKQGFLTFLNTQTEKQYEFIYHQVSEQRGLLTNLIHNQVKKYLVGHYDLVPLLFYPEGVGYLAERGREIRLRDEDLAAMGASVAQAAASMTRGSFAKFIKSGNQGIKVDKQCLELGISFADIWGVVYDQVMAKVSGKRFKIDGEIGVESKCREEMEATLSKKQRLPVHASIRKFLKRPSVCPPTQGGMGAGELLRAYYIFLNAHFAKKVGAAWDYLYRWLNLPEDVTKVYDLLDPLYQRAYVVAHNENLALDGLLPRILEDGKRVMGDVVSNEMEPVGDFAALGEYVARTVTFSFPSARSTNFAEALRYYVDHNQTQCCYCGSEFETDNLMSNQVPANIMVQSYSNRLSGGSPRGPKRNVCALCRSQFILEKLNHVAGKSSKTIYLHLYPYSFFTEVFLNSLRAEVREILNQDTTVLFPKTDDAIQEIIASEGKRTPLRFYTRNKEGKAYTNGLPLPLNYSEVLGNVLTFPLNCPGDNDSEQFLFALQNALLLGRYFGCKVLLTDSAVPILSKSDFSDLFIDNVPLGFGGLLPTNDFDRAGLAALWQDVALLFRLRGLLYNPGSEQNLFLPLIQSLASEERFILYHLVDRLIEAKTDNPGRAIALAKDCLPVIHNLLKGENRMKPLQTLAEAAWRDHIIGSSLKRNSLLKPFDMMLDGLEAKSEAFGLDTLRAQMTEEIFRHLEAIAADEYKPGRTKREKVKAYVDAFFDGVLNVVYRGNVQKLLSDVKPLRSAYLFYIREQIPTKEKGEKP
jgi:CRISPR-associated protein Csc3